MEKGDDNHIDYGFEDDEDSEDERNEPVRLNQPIDLNDLCNKQEVTFEIKPEGEYDHVEKTYFEPDEVFHQLNKECINVEESTEDPFDAQILKSEDVSDGHGLVWKKIDVPGVGDIVPEYASVEIHYNGYLELSDEPFDSTYLRGRSERKALGRGDLLPGLELGICTMRKDEEAQFILLPDVAFGKMGCPPRIAPNARVMFKVRLIDFVDCTASNEYENSTAEEQRNMSFDKREEVVKSHREAGRVMFETGRYTQARKRYRKAIRLLEECRLQDEIEEKRQQELLLKLYLNMSVTSIKIGSFPQGITFARQALELEQDNAKALYQIGKCKMNLADFDEARHNLVRAQKLEPNNDKIKNLLVDLDRREKAYRLDEKNMYQRMFQPANSQAAPKNPESCPTTGNIDLLTTEFASMMRRKLSEFKERQEVPDLTLGSRQLLDSQLETVTQLASELNLRVTKTVEGEDKFLKIERKT